METSRITARTRRTRTTKAMAVMTIMTIMEGTATAERMGMTATRQRRRLSAP